MPLPKFSEADYDFSDVESSELEACCFYEFARESSAVISEVAGERKDRKKRKGKTGTIKFGPRVQNNVQTHFLFSLSLTSGFPGQPWRKLSQNEKVAILKCQFAIPHLAIYA